MGRSNPIPSLHFLEEQVLRISETAICISAYSCISMSHCARLHNQCLQRCRAGNGLSGEDDTAHARKRRRLDSHDDQHQPAYKYPGHNHDCAEEIPIDWLGGCNEQFISGTPSQLPPQTWNPETSNQDAGQEQCIEVAEEVPLDCCYGMARS